MPLAIAGRSVPLLFAPFCERHFVGMNPVLSGRPERPVNTDSLVIASGHQRRARCRADRRRYLEIRKSHAATGHSVQMGCLIRSGPEGTDVRISHVVNEHDDNVRQARLGARRIGSESKGEANGNPNSPHEGLVSEWAQPGQLPSTEKREKSSRTLIVIS